MAEVVVLKVQLAAQEIGDLAEAIAEFRPIVGVLNRAAVGIGHAGKLGKRADGLPDVGLLVAVAVGNALHPAGGGGREVIEQAHRPIGGP